MHVEGRVCHRTALHRRLPGRIDLDSLTARLSPLDVADYYRARAGTGVELGPSFRTLGRAWSAPGKRWARCRSRKAWARTRWTFIRWSWTAAFRSWGPPAT